MEEVDVLVSKGAIHWVDPRTLGFYSHIFLLAKKNGTWKFVFDLSILYVSRWSRPGRSRQPSGRTSEWYCWFEGRALPCTFLQWAPGVPSFSS